MTQGEDCLTILQVSAWQFLVGLEWLCQHNNISDEHCYSRHKHPDLWESVQLDLILIFLNELQVEVSYRYICKFKYTYIYTHTEEIQRSSNNVSDWSETNAWGQAVSKVMVDFWHGHRVTCNSVGSVATRSQAVFGPSQVVTRIFGVVESRCNQDGAKIEPRWGQVWLRRGQDGVKLCQDGVKRDVVRMRRRMKTLMATSPQTSGSQSTAWEIEEKGRGRGEEKGRRRGEERGRGEEKGMAGSHSVKYCSSHPSSWCARGAFSPSTPN